MPARTDAVARPAVRDERVSSVGVLFTAAARLERALGSALEEQCGLSHVWFEVLLRLDQAPEGTLTPTQITEALVLTSGGVTRLIDRMSAAGLVERRTSLTDRRSTPVAITTDGRTRLVAAAEVHALNVQELFIDPLGPARLAALLEALRAL